MSDDPLETLVKALLYEGYALYPYTPGATKNATPTPFGIVYPPAYAALSASTFDHLQLECVLLAGAEPLPPLFGTVRFLQAEGVRHQALERRVELTGAEPSARFSFGDVRGSARLAAHPLDPRRTLVTLRVENTTPVDGAALERAEALASSLLSCHPVVRVEGGARFASPLEVGEAARSVNTFPVLATDADDAVLGAAIVLPDHPQIAPESLGDLFDGTEIEEALILHVQALSDAERRSIADQDPGVREMIARAERATPTELLRLHGRLRMEDG